MGYHVLLGLVWAWFLRERWGMFNVWWVVTAVIGSVLPDIEHIYYFLGYGRSDSYTKEVFGFIQRHEWRNLFHFISVGHKHNTSLAFHNIFTVAFFVMFGAAASFISWKLGVVLFGAIVSHYIFDIMDDLLQMGEVNSNWTRWGRPKSGRLLRK